MQFSALRTSPCSALSLRLALPECTLPSSPESFPYTQYASLYSRPYCKRRFLVFIFWPAFYIRFRKLYMTSVHKPPCTISCFNFGTAKRSKQVNQRAKSRSSQAPQIPGAPFFPVSSLRYEKSTASAISKLPLLVRVSALITAPHPSFSPISLHIVRM